MSNRRHLPILIAVLVASALAGCSHATRQPASQTALSAEAARPPDWFEQPGIVEVRSGDYERLFEHTQQVLRQRRFAIDRRDYRNGVITTLPLVSKQVWEFWRSDVVDTGGLTASSLATHRRSVRWEIRPDHRSGFVATPKVVIERFTAPAHRITSVTRYQSTLSQAETHTALTPQNLRTLGEGHWYAIGRDADLERALADDLTHRLD